MNDITRNGFVAFDSSIMEEVLVTGIVLCFLADSPMHAEITNTPNPGTSLNPCRMCTLHAEGKDKRNTPEFVQQFLMINPDGSEATGKERNWIDTKEKTYDLYCAAMEESNAEFVRRKLKYGLTESRNTRFLTEAKKNLRIRELMEKLEEKEPESLFNSFLELEGFDGVQDTPVEILHVVLLGIVKYLACDMGKNLTETQKDEFVGRIQSFNTQALDIPPINANSMMKHIKSLVGKEFKVLVQAAPFTFFQFLSPERKAIWTAVCQLVPFIFITKIENMQEYITRLKIYIKNFLYHAIRTTAQWVNKPKFHHLKHLPESIIRFGSASLCSTEKFESFNGILRNASIHSNKQSAGRDIAITFSNYYSDRFLLSGGYIYDHSTQTHSTASQDVLNVFQNNEVIRKSLGYSFQASNPLPPQEFPFVKKVNVILEDQLEVPQQLIEHCSSHNIRQVSQVQLNKHDVLEKGYFVLIQCHGSELLVGSVKSLWEFHSRARSKFYIHFNQFKLMGMNELYSMREICRTTTTNYFNVIGEMPNQEDQTSKH
ncbi:uncharacterized protein PGTG_21277 [Puccinia graminis f. sp. tritici CRL 75-36-700-3]|uniref:Uncharacterized protein n=1 Tax=Puccinia graminis f. sp. tritici (strain CRL 75-36-700-3 / race SCCL) TaxID=418459 RepID=H6QQZ0_PUCGT|nr:uncharacterized protein PGTG_21277 [Puccinia graminis f. sp. tritici CRL 75-36-700-3]EHS62927.1 hypothetical protein PGTG_21277 [Puccinia graminis f. sp. tritici CRL 75-36-700-3]